MLQRFLQLVGLSCRHRNMSRPFAVSAEPHKNGSADWDTVDEAGHCIVCLDCGKRFRYDWSRMRVIH